MSNRREFIRNTLAILGAGTAGVLSTPVRTGATKGRARRVFVPGFSHETNTFHPIRTTGSAGPWRRRNRPCF